MNCTVKHWFLRAAWNESIGSQKTRDTFRHRGPAWKRTRALKAALRPLPFVLLPRLWEIFLDRSVHRRRERGSAIVQGGGTKTPHLLVLIFGGKVDRVSLSREWSNVSETRPLCSDWSARSSKERREQRTSRWPPPRPTKTAFVDRVRRRLLLDDPQRSSFLFLLVDLLRILGGGGDEGGREAWNLGRVGERAHPQSLGVPTLWQGVRAVLRAAFLRMRLLHRAEFHHRYSSGGSLLTLCNSETVLRVLQVSCKFLVVEHSTFRPIAITVIALVRVQNRKLVFKRANVLNCELTSKERVGMWVSISKISGCLVDA